MPASTIIFFDLDQTLIDHTNGRKAARVLLAQIADQNGKSVDQLSHEVHVEHRTRVEERPNDLLTMDWDDVFNTVAVRNGVTLTTTFLALWEQYIREDPASVVVLDDAPEVLRALKTPHRKLVLATKGLSKFQFPLLHATGLYALLDDHLTPDITGYLKTQPGYFDKYRDLEDTCIIQVGDHYYDDVVCARRNHFHTVLRAPVPELDAYPPFERPDHIDGQTDAIRALPESDLPVRPDAVVTHLNQLPDVIEAIEAQCDR
jgi:FMN phosphatase YigB (HAD superfamily)